MAETRTLGELIEDGVIEATNGFPFGGHNSDGSGVPHIRPFNVATNGEITLAQIKSIPSETAVDKPRLRRGDVVFNNTNTKELVGKCAVWDQDTDPVFSNHMTRIRANEDACDSTFLSFAIFHHWIIGKSEMLARAHVAQASIMGERFREIEVPWVPLAAQRTIAQLIATVRAARRSDARQEEHAQRLKQAAMRELFTRGLRGEAQKETEIGPVPESWNPTRLSDVADVLSTRMSYSELESAQSSAEEDAVPVLGIKVSDMNRVGNEVELHDAALTARLARKVAEYRAAPPGTIIFPKRGAAIATNKKRLSTTWTVFDPNVIGVRSLAALNQRFLFHWFQDFDLRTITEPGPTPQLNKKNLEPLLVPVPLNPDEQREIVAVLDAIDRKIDLHRKKRAVLEELFQALLHKLMTGEVRVDQLDLSALASAKSGATV